jgi:hypothetical protein
MKLNPYNVFIMYMALKNHFHSNYDYFKYHGRVKISQDHFLSRKDKYYFIKLGRIYPEDELENFFISNFTAWYPDKIWIGDLTGQDAKDIYLDRQKRIEAFTYTFTNDLDKLFEGTEPNESFQVRKGQVPKIVLSYLRSEISLETIAAIDTLIDFIPAVDKKLDRDDLLWGNFKNLVTKYKPFFKFDEVKMKHILREKV